MLRPALLLAGVLASYVVVGTTQAAEPELRFLSASSGTAVQRVVLSDRGVELHARVGELDGGPVVLEYAVTNADRARVAEDGRAIRFAQHRLGELTVRDAAGRDLPARWELGPGRVRLVVDATHADRLVHVAALFERLRPARIKRGRAPGAEVDAAHGTPPPNDTCAAADDVPGAGPFPWVGAVRDAAGATDAGDPPPPSCQPDVSRSLWYRFTPAATTEYTFTLCADAPTETTLEDTVLAIYTAPNGRCDGGLDEIAGGCDDDGCTLFQSAIRDVRLVAGRTYFIVAYAYGDAPPAPDRSAVQLRVERQPPVAPPHNDRCEDAEAIAGAGPFPAFAAPLADISGADSEGDPAPPDCQPNVSRSVWYRFTPAAGGRYEIAVCADGPAASTVDDTVLAVYRGSACGALEPLAGGCDDDGCVRETRQSALDVELEAGATYSIAVHTFGSSRPLPGHTSLQLRVAPVGPAPANDHCAGAEVIPSAAALPYLSAVTENRDATSAGDPDAPCRAGAARGLWYRYRPSETGRYELALCGTASATTVADTVLTVYASDSGTCGDLVPVAGACDDDGCAALADQSVIASVELSAGTTYYALAQQAGDTRYGPADALVQLRVARSAEGADGDGDGAPDSTDCAPADAAAWSVPGPARELEFEADGETLVWRAPDSPGGTGVRFDVLRSTDAAAFGAPSCLETNTVETHARDAARAAPLFAYLVRARNACGANSGSDAAGVPRQPGPCP